jgi:hypothetical protein
MPSSMYKSFVLDVNKLVLNWTHVCQLHCKTQLHKRILCKLLVNSCNVFVCICKFSCLNCIKQSFHTNINNLSSFIKPSNTSKAYSINMAPQQSV